jgi:hypothetical protein
MGGCRMHEARVELDYGCGVRYMTGPASTGRVSEDRSRLKTRDDNEGESRNEG